MASVTALNDQFAVQPGVSATLDVLSNDSNPDGTGLQVIAHTAITPAGPTLADNGDGTFTFTSAAPGTFTFDYTVTGAEHELTNPDASAEDQFGNSVAISGDTVVVGALRNNEGDADDEGAAYVFVRSGTGWSLQQKLTIPAPNIRDQFGHSVAVSGDTVVVGAIGDDQIGEDNAGVVYVYVRSGTTWSLQQKLINPDPAVNDNFGYSVAVSGDNVVVGVPNDDEGAINAGAAYVYARSGATWSLQQKITNPAPADFDHFGDVVATSGETVVVGAYADDEGDAGAAYVYMRSGTAWSLQQKLPNPDPEGNDYFGSAVAISGDTVVVGALGDNFGGDAAGAAYVYMRTGTNWTLQQKITNPNPAFLDLFGSAVAVSGETAAVGAHADDEGATDAGAAYVYTRTGTNWTLQHTLTNPDPAINENFGWAVAVSGETVVVGAINNTVGGNYGAGSIYLRNVTQDTATVMVTVDIDDSPQLADIDIKPNSINLASQGVIPIALFGSATFDVTTVDIGSILFAGASVSHYEWQDVNSDGHTDLVLHFRTQETNLRDLYAQLLADADTIADGILDSGVSTRQTETVSLTGALTTGCEFSGTDRVDLFFSGAALRDFLGELAGLGMI